MGDGGASHLVSPSGPTLFPGSRGVTWGGGGQGDLWVEDKTPGQPGGEADVNREIPGSSCNLLGGAGSSFKLIYPVNAVVNVNRHKQKYKPAIVSVGPGSDLDKKDGMLQLHQNRTES